MTETVLLQLRLASSMETQTEVVPKTPYNELKKCRFLARITAQLETYDHDNYCSDEECEYVKKIVRVSTKVPEQYRDLDIQKIENTQEYAWSKHLPVPEIQVTGSGFCQFKYVEGGVGQHCYRYKIKKVEIVENPKYAEKENEHVILKGVNNGSIQEYMTDIYGFPTYMLEFHRCRICDSYGKESVI